jgi:hypothetical protein
MIQNQSLYQVEKMLLQQHEEMNRRMRSGLYRKQCASRSGTVGRKQDEISRSLWHKWFKKRRLDTSWK